MQWMLQLKQDSRLRDKSRAIGKRAFTRPALMPASMMILFHLFISPQ